MLEGLKQTYRQARFKVRYTIADYKQRYYSNSGNPRIIAARVDNQPLVSLRTEPHDKYLHSPGSFLVVPEEEKPDIDDMAKMADFFGGEMLEEKSVFDESKWNIVSMLGRFAAFIPAAAREMGKETVGDEAEKEDPNITEIHPYEVPPRNIWKSICHETSLSAARVSTGVDVPQLRDSYLYLAADLTEARICSHPQNGGTIPRDYMGILSLYGEASGSEGAAGE